MMNQPADSFSPSRSPLLMNAQNSALVVIDVQEKLLPHIQDAQRISFNIGRLIEGAQILAVPVVVTEQYPKGLGATVEPIREQFSDDEGNSKLFQPVGEKTVFSCRECDDLFQQLSQAGVHNLVLSGIETHVCVAQTALDMLAQGFNVFLCLDTIGSRHALDHETAIRRLESSGCTVTTTEAVLFEWCERAGNPQFKAISKLVQKQN